MLRRFTKIPPFAYGRMVDCRITDGGRFFSYVKAVSSTTLFVNSHDQPRPEYGDESDGDALSHPKFELTGPLHRS